ncbi:MAG: hypothetical protein QOH60_3718 [Mycobacterium sp.]|jgi:hypothetical protein|nr:hypothetical protein [Mycobacterium sp.]
MVSTVGHIQCRGTKAAAAASAAVRVVVLSIRPVILRGGGPSSRRARIARISWPELRAELLLIYRLPRVALRVDDQVCGSCVSPQRGVVQRARR